MAGLVVEIVRGTTKAGATILGAFGVADENDEHRQRVEVKCIELERLAEDVRNAGLSILPLSCQQGLQRFNESLCTCAEVCEKMRNRGALANLYHAQRHRRDLEVLERLLSEVHHSIQQVCFSVLLAQNEELWRRVVEGETRLEAEAIHPGAGIYKGAPGGCKEKVPRAPDKPEVVVDGTLMAITWRDTQNSSEGIIRYEVRYEDEKELIAFGTPKELKVGKKKEGTYAMTLGPPKIVPGEQNVYTIQVRAVSRLGGPGEWSEAIVARLGVGPPNKPKKPTITALSPREVLVHVQRPGVDEENGRPVREYIIEFMSRNADVVSQWQSLRYPIMDSDVGEASADVLMHTVRGLEPGSVYHFRVKMVNEAGSSLPSKAEDVCMEQLVPGPPQDLRVSTKRTDKIIKIRWKPPAIYPQSVNKYIVHMQLKRGRQAQNEWSVVKECSEKLSATIRDLKAKTKYRFRVAAINFKGELGNFSKVMVAETRCGMGGRLTAAAGAFVGGTVGAPLLGAVGIGRYAISVVSDYKVGSDAVKMAACTAAGVGGVVTGTVMGAVGAPLFGVAAAALGYESAAGRMTDWSPQSSDDEREPPTCTIRELWKASLPH